VQVDQCSVVADEVGQGAAVVPPAPGDMEGPPHKQWLMVVGEKTTTTTMTPSHHCQARVGICPMSSCLRWWPSKQGGPGSGSGTPCSQ
jgi:hypothetical protein